MNEQLMQAPIDKVLISEAPLWYPQQEGIIEKPFKWFIKALHTH